ncbi:hypothetical protein ACFL6Y_06815 [Elusimicrobiota bacterium]
MDDEIKLFKEMGESIRGTGVVSREERKFMGMTIEKEKAWILRKTMEQIYENAFSLYREGRYSEAASLLKRVNELDPSFDRARALYAALKRFEDVGRSMPIARDTRKEIIAEKFQEAFSTYNNGLKVESLQRFEEVLALEPRHAKARYYIKKVNTELAAEYRLQGDKNYEEGRMQPALDSYYLAITLDPEITRGLSKRMMVIEADLRQRRVNVHITDALKALSASKWKDARAHARKILPLDPGNARAQEIISQALNDEAGYYFSKGNAQMKKKSWNKAIPEYEKVIKLGKRTREAKKQIDLAKGNIQRKKEAARRKVEEEKARKDAQERAKAATASAKEEREEKKKPKSGLEMLQKDSSIAGLEGDEEVPEDAKEASRAHMIEPMKLYAGGNLHKALEKLSLALKFDPNNKEAYSAKRRIQAALAK